MAALAPPAWRRARPPTPVFLPGESHGQRSLVGYSPWDRRVGHDWSNWAGMHTAMVTSFLSFRTILNLKRVFPGHTLPSTLGTFPNSDQIRLRGHEQSEDGVKWKYLLPHVLVPQLWPALCHTTDCTPPGSSVHGILQARILEGVAIFFSRRSSRPRDWTQVSCIADRFFTIWATREAVSCCINKQKISQPSVLSGFQMWIRAPQSDPVYATTPHGDCWRAGEIQKAWWTRKQAWPQIAEVYVRGMNSVRPEACIFPNIECSIPQLNTWSAMFRLSALFVANLYRAWLPLLPSWSSFLRASELQSPGLRVLNIPTN